MTAQQLAIAKIQDLPEALSREVNDYIDFLLLKRDASRWQLWNQFHETQTLAEADVGEYGKNLVEYEELLARGEIRW